MEYSCQSLYYLDILQIMLEMGHQRAREGRAANLKPIMMEFITGNTQHLRAEQHVNIGSGKLNNKKCEACQLRHYTTQHINCTITVKKGSHKLFGHIKLYQQQSSLFSTME
jgi:hypothetical protein